MAISPNTITEALEWRYATKRFDSTKKISAENWQALENSLRLAPSSFGLQPWKFLVVDDAQTRAALREHSWNQPQIIEASHMVVLCMKKNLGSKEVEQYVSLIAETRGLKVEQLADYKKMMLDFISRDASQFDVNAWASKQLYIALGMFLQTAAMLGVDACPMEGINAAKYDEILGLSASGYGTVVVATAGYRSSQDPLAGMKKVRFQPAQVIERR